MSSLDCILPLKPIERSAADRRDQVMVTTGAASSSSAMERCMPRPVAPLVPESVLWRSRTSRVCGDEISEAQPILDAPGGRVTSRRDVPAVCRGGPALTIRKFTRRYTLEDTVTVGSLDAGLAERLTAAVAGQQNILISGGTGTGKTTPECAGGASPTMTDRSH